MSDKKICFAYLSGADRKKMRVAIVNFCVESKTRQEIEAQFNLDGVTVAAIMSGLVVTGFIKQRGDKKLATYKKA